VSCVYCYDDIISRTHIYGLSSSKLHNMCTAVRFFILGVSLTQRSVKHGRRSSVAAGYLRPAMSRPNLDVLVRKHVTKVINTTHCVVTRATLGCYQWEEPNRCNSHHPLHIPARQPSIPTSLVQLSASQPAPTFILQANTSNNQAVFRSRYCLMERKPLV